MTATTPLDTDVITQAAALISEPGVWIQGAYDDGHGHVCAHGAVLRQHCTPGDQHMWRMVMWQRGLSEEWNDATDRTAEEVAERFALIAAERTAADMADAFGPQWEAIRDLVRRVAALTPAELDKLAAAREAAWPATGEAAGAAAWAATGEAGGAAAWEAARAAARALAVHDLIGEQFTQTHYDTQTGPLRSIGITVHPADAPYAEMVSA